LREFGRRRARLYDDNYMECLATEFSSPLPAPAPEEALANK
jgi:hypothetical protein